MNGCRADVCMRSLCLQGETWSEDAINFFFNLSMETELKMDVIKADGRNSSLYAARVIYIPFTTINIRLVIQSALKGGEGRHTRF